MNGITFKRKGRKSMLGTRQLKLLPIEPITEKSPSEENASLFQHPEPVIIEEPVKEVVREEPLHEPLVENPVKEEPLVENPVKEEPLVENPVKEEPYEEPEPPRDELVIKAVRKNLICSLFPDDSFEANETMLANTSFNDTALATTLLMSAKKKEDTVLSEKNNESVPVKKQDETLEQVLDTITLLLKKNAETIENSKQERVILTEMKKRVLEKIQK